MAMRHAAHTCICSWPGWSHATSCSAESAMYTHPGTHSSCQTTHHGDGVTTLHLHNSPAGTLVGERQLRQPIGAASDLLSYGQTLTIPGEWVINNRGTFYKKGQIQQKNTPWSKTCITGTKKALWETGYGWGEYPLCHSLCREKYST